MPSIAWLEESQGSDDDTFEGEQDSEEAESGLSIDSDSSADEADRGRTNQNDFYDNQIDQDKATDSGSSALVYGRRRDRSRSPSYSYSYSSDYYTDETRSIRDRRQRARSENPIEKPSVLDWLKQSNQITVNPTISQDKTGGAEQDDGQLLKLFAKKLQTVAETGDADGKTREREVIVEERRRVVDDDIVEVIEEHSPPPRRRILPPATTRRLGSLYYPSTNDFPPPPSKEGTTRTRSRRRLERVITEEKRLSPVEYLEPEKRRAEHFRTRPSETMPLVRRSEAQPRVLSDEDGISERSIGSSNSAADIDDEADQLLPDLTPEVGPASPKVALEPLTSEPEFDYDQLQQLLSLAERHGISSTLMDRFTANEDQPRAHRPDSTSRKHAQPKSVRRSSNPLAKPKNASTVNGHTAPSDDIWAPVEGPPQRASVSSRRAEKSHGKAKAKAVPSPQESIDWRLHLCQVLNLNPESPDSTLLGALWGRPEHLTRPTEKQKRSKPEISYMMLYRINCQSDKTKSVYEDLPYFLNPESGTDHLRGRRLVSNMELYIERHQGVSFIVFKDFICCHPSDKKNTKLDGDPSASSESAYLISHELCSALKTIARNSDNTQLYPAFRVEHELQKPYLWFYHERPFMESYLGGLKSKYRRQVELFMEYIILHLGDEYKAVDEQISEGMISSKYLEYLFIPNEVLLEKDKDKDAAYDRAFVQQNWPKKSETRNAKAKEAGDGKSSNSQSLTVSLAMQVSYWEYDGSFQNTSTSVGVELATLGSKTSKIQDLTIYPLKYAEEGKREALMKRGRKFWESRHMRYISYNGWDFTRAEYFTDVRFMIDITTYRKMHAEAPIFKRRLRDDLGTEALARDEPPDGNFLLMLPPNVFGFNMQEKKWMNLLIEHTKPVVWNQEAFDTLVVNPDTKTLIMALVTNKIEANKSTDLMSGKGNGLIVLLHGGPGTGKTLTAESVAEFAKKPLYRVTCGDVGTKPEDVENYLRSVLTVGKIWDCVVLLDEAEVFLQERNLKDLQRNALVSVFLRVLEYYEGILILTSNRVATFDEAFKSRIQLALHYEPLKEPQRRQIWENFINRLKTFQTDEINIEDLQKNLDKLKKFDMNGRQIRNAVTTARQLAMFKKEAMNYSTLEHVINVSSRFDIYLKGVNEGLTDEELARDGRLR